MSAETEILNRKGARGESLLNPITIAMNLVAYPMLALWTLVGIALFPIGFVLWKLFTRWSSGRIMRHFIWIYGQGWLLLMAPFIRFRREGFQNLRTDESCVIVVNHLSFFDTYCMSLLPIHDIIFAVRAWPFGIICYGWFMRLAEYLNVETSEWKEVQQKATVIFADGGRLLFFPEGHRSRTGELQRFQSGAFKLASDMKVCVIPLCIKGTDNLLPPGRLWLRPAEITLRVLPPLEGRDFPGNDGARKLRELVHARIAENLMEMQNRAV
ncbi:MAG: 1-acyl-sn-glycerol-3-phosphate acyltransferase [Nitrospirota bacterium]|nr:1-acyl-sn-glycerol-3-phosphate acyltransferase [Nitrospirota bacterium]